MTGGPRAALLAAHLPACAGWVGGRGHWLAAAGHAPAPAPPPPLAPPSSLAAAPPDPRRVPVRGPGRADSLGPAYRRTVHAHPDVGRVRNGPGVQRGALHPVHPPAGRPGVQRRPRHRLRQHGQLRHPAGQRHAVRPRRVHRHLPAPRGGAFLVEHGRREDERGPDRRHTPAARRRLGRSPSPAGGTAASWCWPTTTTRSPRSSPPAGRSARSPRPPTPGRRRSRCGTAPPRRSAGPAGPWPPSLLPNPGSGLRGP